MVALKLVQTPDAGQGQQQHEPVSPSPLRIVLTKYYNISILVQHVLSHKQMHRRMHGMLQVIHCDKGDLRRINNNIHSTIKTKHI